MRTDSPRDLGLFAILAGTILLGCHPTPQPIPLNFIPKCPQHPFALEVVEPSDSGFVKKVVSVIALSGELTPVVEVHDCQRLIVAAPGASGLQSMHFGPLAMIFSSDSLRFLVDSANHALPRRAAAVIYSWDKDDPRTGDYPALGIKGGWNCLYIYQGDVDIRARMVPVDRQEDCLQRPGKEGTTLEVRTKLPPSGLTAKDIPAVARWGWASSGRDSTNDILIRCGSLACEIGPMGFTPELALSNDVRALVIARTGASPEAQAVLEFGGWYDQQRLAELNGDLTVGGVLATLIPWPGLGQMNIDAAFDTTWVPVALAYLPGASPFYSKKLNLSNGLNVIYMRRGTLPASVTIQRPCRADNTSDPWWAMIETPQGVKEYFCMNRYLHGLSPDKMPGTVRWQWLDDDEKTWIRCPQGCCPIS